MFAMNSSGIRKSLGLIPAAAMIAALSACESPYAIRVSTLGGGGDSLSSAGDKPVVAPIGAPSSPVPGATASPGGGSPMPGTPTATGASPRPVQASPSPSADEEDDDSWTNISMDGKIACDRLMRSADSAIVMSEKTGEKSVDPGLPTNISIENRESVAIAAADRINAITEISGDIEVNARSIGPIRGLHGHFSVNALSIESIAAIHGNGRFVADRLGTSADTFGNIKINVGAMDLIQGAHGHTAVVARKSSSGKLSTVQLVEGIDGHLLVCGMNVHFLRGIRGLVVVVGGDVEEVNDVKGKVVVIGGKVGKSTGVESQRIEVR